MVIVLGSQMLGCSKTSDAMQLPRQSSSGASATDQDRIVFDAGIIFTNRDNYVCFPTDKIGISKASEVKSVTTSCECLEVRIKDIATGNGNSFAAIELLFARNEVFSIKSRVIPLGIDVAICLTNGAEFQVVIKCKNVNDQV